MNDALRPIALLLALAGCGGGAGISAGPASMQSPGTTPGVMPPADPNALAAVQLHNGEGGLGLDDLRYSARLARVISPAARTGEIDLVDPETLEVSVIGGLTSAGRWDGSDLQGVESADEGRGLVFGNDRTKHSLIVADGTASRLLATVTLDPTEPDYVRWSESTSEVWVTQPGSGRIDVLSLPAGATTPQHAAFVELSNGPEGIAIDNARGRAYVHAFSGDIVAIDLRTRSVVATWPTGCSSSHGIPIVDEARGFVFAGCSSARVAVLDADHDGRILDSFTLDGGGATILAYSLSLHHFYLRGDPGVKAVVIGVASDGKLSMLGGFDVPSRGHCMTADDRGHLWVCDWLGGRLLRFTDPYDRED
jgi:hypothetical protein